MTEITFRHNGDMLSGFEVSGHADGGDYGNDIVCAAISSAAYLTANTMFDVFGVDGSAETDEIKGRMKLDISGDQPERALEDGGRLIEGFMLHMQQLSEQYPENVRVIIQ